MPNLTKKLPKLVLLLSIILIGIIIYTSSVLKKEITELHTKKVSESLNAVLQTTNEGLNNWAKELEGLARFITRNDQILEQVINLTAYPVKKNNESAEELNKTLRQLVATHNFLEVSILSKNMKILSNSTTQKIGMTSNTDQLYEIISKLNEGHIIFSAPEKSTEVFINEQGKKEKNIARICLYAPISVNHEIIAYLIIKIKPADKFNNIFQSGRIGKTGETYALRSDGLMVSETRFLSDLRKKDPNVLTSVLKQRITNPANERLTVMAQGIEKKQAGRNLIGYNDYRGVPVIGHWLWNDNFKIGITTEQDHLEAYKELFISIKHINNFTIVLVIAIVLLTMLFFYGQRIEQEKRKILLNYNENLQIQVQEGIREAENANKAKSRFFSQMSHEIRTPMNAIIGYAELLEQSSLTEDQTENLRHISESGTFLLQLINEILDFSKMEAGEFTLEEQPFDLRLISENVVDLLRYKTSTLNVILKLEIDPELGEFFIGDSHRLKQIIMNLTSNALKFTEKGEVIVYLKKVQDEKNIEWIEISVKDTGIGIEHEKIDIIFDDFTQANSSTSRKYGGTGLGLTITKKIVEAMKGEIGVTSSLGKGSTFWFQIPLVKTNSIATNETVLEYDKESIKDLKVLIAEDNSVNRKLAIKLLTLVGFENLKTASDGNEAVEFVKNNPVDIIFMDVMMPDLDGIEATKMIRDLGFDSEQLKIIALTANAFSEDRSNCIKAGMNEHIKKPFRKTDVIACLKQLNIC
ncbi:hybrid sensor histidine kinase/response regulator [Halobacteriovorax sp. HLS]|uniref:hybrid sensor histidine kinase/response regulator n=1 Tax=Halobacteriovorax sp. HLS TaxID=2234000 RepID=UPI000FDB48CB|nr:hybrid sensor histidine kinase/response regulator [Halobacteriovorax sp. HLS]